MAGMPQRVFEGWRRYWNEEPWGAWRENLHTAVLAREIAKTVPRRRSTPELKDFFYRNPFGQKQPSNVPMVLGVMAQKVTAEEARARMKAARSARKNSARRRKKR